MHLSFGLYSTSFKESILTNTIIIYTQGSVIRARINFTLKLMKVLIDINEANITDLSKVVK